MSLRRLAMACVPALCAVAVSGCGGGGSSGGPPPSLSGFQIVTGPSSVVGTRGGITATASCPSGKSVIGGGFSTANEGSNVHASFPTSTGNGWTIMARNENFIGPAITMSPTAVCVNTPAGYEVRSVDADVASRQTASVAAKCTDLTRRLIGGGFRSADPMVANYASSFDPSVVSNSTVSSDPIKWVSEFRSNHPIAASSGVTSFAICASVPAVAPSYLASPTTTIGTQTNSTLTVACDTTSPQTRVAAGGVSANVSLANIYDSQPIGTATTAPTAGGNWTALVRNPQSAGEPAIDAMLLLVCVAAT
jgi:hypothetical protein